MNHDVIKQVIYDQRQVIQASVIVHRDYFLEPSANHIIVGLRRAGKSTLLYERVLELVAQGVGWDQIVYVNFEDERLLGMALSDLNDVVEVAAELTDSEPYYFFDEIQTVEGWERFARRLADAHQHVSITGSNAEMLSSEMEQRLGGRYLSSEVMPYSFGEYLTARGIRHDDEALHTSELVGKLRRAAGDYLAQGGFPESVGYQDRRSYADSVYQKVLLGDMAARHNLRNVATLRMLMKKVAETVTSEVTFSGLRKAVTATGARLSTDSVIDYIAYAQDAYLLFCTHNYVAKFAERESTPRYYFGDNGILSLFLVDKASLLLENAVALAFRRRFGNEVYYLKSERTGIDVDFYVPEEGLAVQAAYALDEGDYARETGSLVALARDKRTSPSRCVIVTYAHDEETIEEDGVVIKVVPLYKFLLEG